VNRSGRAAAFLLFLLLFYYEVYRWIPLGKWNWQVRWPVQNDQFYPDIVTHSQSIAKLFRRRLGFGLGASCVVPSR
jgi:hypothetical protein